MTKVIDLFQWKNVINLTDSPVGAHLAQEWSSSKTMLWKISTWLEYSSAPMQLNSSILSFRRKTEVSKGNLYSIKLLRIYLASSYKPMWIIQPWRSNISQRQVKSGKDLQYLSTPSNASSCVPGSAMTTPSIVHLEMNHSEYCELLVLHRRNKLLNKFLEMSIWGCSRPIGSENFQYKWYRWRMSLCFSELEIWNTLKQRQYVLTCLVSSWVPKRVSSSLFLARLGLCFLAVK